MTQNCFWWFQDCPRWCQDGPKLQQDGPKLPQKDPKWPQDGISWSQDHPKWSQDGPRLHQDGSRLFQKNSLFFPPPKNIKTQRESQPRMYSCPKFAWEAEKLDARRLGGMKSATTPRCTVLQQRGKGHPTYVYMYMYMYIYGNFKVLLRHLFS